MTAYILQPALVEPVSLERTKAHLRLDGAHEDSLVSSLITAARLHLEHVTQRALIEQVWRLVLDKIPSNGCIDLPQGPLISIEAMVLYDDDGNSSPLAVAEIVTDLKSVPGRIIVPSSLHMGVPLRNHLGIEIDYKVGYGASQSDVPPDLVQALLSLVAHWFDNRDAVIATGGGAILPNGFDRIVQPFKVMGL